ncbi:H-NS histone family protein [Escherichia coli]
MSEAIKQINNIRTLRAQARELPIEVLEELLEKLTTVIDERREEEATRKASEAERTDKLEAFRKMMLEDGIDPSELLAIAPATSKGKKVREPRPAKYQYTDESGETKFWTGQGRTPKAIAAKLESGATLADFEIK